MSHFPLIPNAKSLILPAFIAGLISCGLFLLVMSLGLGFVFMFLPTLPLFWVGFGRGEKTARVALGVAILALSLAGNPASAILFLLLFGFPAWLIVRQSLRHHPTGETIVWYPIGAIMLQLAVYASVLLASVSVFYYLHEPGGLPQMLSDNIHATFSELETDYGDIIELMAGAWAFLIFPITLWLWGMMLYAHAWFAHWALKRNKKNLRPSFAVEPFHMPSWMLSLLAIWALASLIGSPQMSFLAKSSIITLLLPYFFLGAATLHQHIRTLPTARFILFFIYFMVFSLFWPALFIVGIGFYEQIKHLSGAQKPTKS